MQIRTTDQQLDLSATLKRLERDQKLPCVTAYNRIDGPGSSLDLREFQEAFWRIPTLPPPESDDEFAEWSRGLPRTVGITVGVGCQVTASPLNSGDVGVVSHDFGYSYTRKAGHVPYRRDLWLLKILDIFALSGVRFDISNLIPGIKSSGLGGSATAATAVALLANELRGRPFGPEQIVAMASLVEQDLGVSITGTQEQSNTVFGGVTDYVWFPWGMPGQCGGFGSSVRRSLLREADYKELDRRIRVYHTGSERSSTDVNSVWRKRLEDDEGYTLHRRQTELAHDFREGIRHQDWQQTAAAIAESRAARVALCPAYMTSKCWDIQSQCERHAAESFPLGAGGGGALLIFGTDPTLLSELDGILSPVYRRVPSEIRPHGHRFENVKEFREECKGAGS